MAYPLARLTIIPGAGGDFELRIESTGGEILEVIATEDQLDVLAEEINELLDASTIDDEDWDEGDEADGGNGADGGES